MFKVIEPQKYCYYRGRVDLFVELMRFQQPISLSPEELELSTFIVAPREDGHIYGGAILQQQHVSELHSQIENVISTVIPNRDHVWTATFSLCEHQVIGEGESRVFYRDLLQQLTEFGNEKNNGFLCLSLTPEEYMRTKQQGRWPYVLEISPQETADDLFYGILSLSGNRGKNQTSPNKLFVPRPLARRQLAA